MNKDRSSGNCEGFSFPSLLAALLLAALVTSEPAAAERWSTHGPYGGLIWTLAIDPVDPSIIYAGGGWNGVFKSTDGGGNWSRTMGDLQADGLFLVYEIALSRGAPGTLFASTSNGLFRSDDDAESWVQLGKGFLFNPSSVAVAQSLPVRVYASKEGGGVYRSSDGGETWVPTGPGLPDDEVRQLVVDPTNPDVVFALVSQEGVFKTIDGGTTWYNASAGLPTVSYSDLILDPAQVGLLYLSSQHWKYGVFRSDDGAKSWSHAGVPSSSVNSLASDPRQQNGLYAGTSDGLYWSKDGGESWLRLDDPSNGFFNDDVVTVAVDSVDPSRIFAGMWRGGIFRSVDRGASWRLSNRGLTNLRARSVAFHPNDENVLYAGTEFGVWKSVDGGRMWTPLPDGPEFPSDLDVKEVLVDRLTPTTVYAGTSGGVWKSVNGGQSWREAASINGIQSLAIDPQTPTTLYAGTQARVYRSDDGGETWYDADEGLPLSFVNFIEVDPETTSTLYAGLFSEGIFKTNNGGEDWFPLESLGYDYSDALAIDPKSTSTLFAEGYSHQLATSLDGGESWSLQIIPGSIAVLDVDPVRPGTIYAGFNSPPRGGFLTRDGGATWQHLEDGLDNTWVRGLAIDPFGGSKLWASTDGGVYEIRVDRLFEDGFESGDTSAWSNTVP